MRFLVLLTCIFFNSLLLGDSAPSHSFDIKEANQQFDILKANLAVPNVKISDYQNAIETLSHLLEKANQCTEDTQKELNNIDALIKQSQKIEKTQNSVDLVYLNTQQKTWADMQGQCRLFTIRATETLSVYKRELIQLKEKTTLTRSPPIWMLYQNTLNTVPNLNFNNLKIDSEKAFFSPLKSVILLGVSVIVALLILFSIKKTQFSKKYLSYPKVKILYVVLLSLSLLTGICLSAMTIKHSLQGNDSGLFTPFLLFWIYFTTWLFLIFAFKVQSIRSLMKWYNLNYRFARASLFFILSAFILAYIGKWLNEMQIFPPLLWQMSQTLYLYGVLLVTFSYVVYYCHTNHQRIWLKHHARLLQMTVFFLLFIPALLATLGYLTLGLQLIFAGFILLTILFFMAAFILGAEKLYHYLNHSAVLKKSILNYFGYKPHQTMTEFLILKITAQLLTVIFGLFLIAKTTGFSNETIEIAYDQFMNGFHIANMTLYPIRIFLGLIIFCLIYLSARALSTKISGHEQFEEEEETQVAVASILTYLGFALAFIIGSLIAGFDFTGLAIIAGALSVGIGLGLQSIVNNFVSGLILLIEKPIKPGDRISIDDIEGVVKKIRVRSTQLMTGSREDVIIPNSDLITRRVINFMLTDKSCRIIFDIEVAYDSDTYLVRDTLLEIAYQHEEVMKSERNKPIVLLNAFGENALIFQLSCLIKDVNKKSLVKSDINFEINRIFKEKNIQMPFTQRDIHLNFDDIRQIKEKI